MTDQKKTPDEPYQGERDTNPSKIPGDAISSRNNNQDAEGLATDSPDVIQPTSSPIGDASVNNDALTKYPSNTSSDA